MTDQTNSPTPETRSDGPVLPGASEPNPPDWRDLFTWLRNNLSFNPKQWHLRKVLLNCLIVAILLFLAAMERSGITHVRENQVGVLVNNLTGSLILKDRVGYHLYIPYLASFYVLDITIQKLELTWAQGPGGIRRDIKLKTLDGSDVSLDVTINYKLDPLKAAEVLQGSGQGMRFAETWMEPFARQVCLATFGELTTEEMYDAKLRNAKAQLTLERLNTLLNPHGINVFAVLPGDFRFYPEYEQVIKDKKLADQKVEEQKAQARAALQDQERQLVEAQYKANAEITRNTGECVFRLIQSRAESDKQKREGDKYYDTTRITADAALYSASAQAVGMRATLLADAEGMEKMRKAMTGKGGIGMVGLEYAKRLQSIRFTGTAVTRDPRIQQFSVQSDGAQTPDFRNFVPPVSTQPARPQAGGAK